MIDGIDGFDVMAVEAIQWIKDMPVEWQLGLGIGVFLIVFGIFTYVMGMD